MKDWRYYLNIIFQDDFDSDFETREDVLKFFNFFKNIVNPMMQAASHETTGRNAMLKQAAKKIKEAGYDPQGTAHKEWLRYAFTD